MNEQWSDKLFRSLHYRADGIESEIIASIGPVREEPDGNWSCEWSLPRIAGENRKLYGVDALQSVMLCLRFFRLTIENTIANGNVVVWWLEEGDHGGF